MKSHQQQCPSRRASDPAGPALRLGNSLPGISCGVSLGALLMVLLAVPSIASAHEVYVLSSGQIMSAIGTPSFNMWDTLTANLGQFVFWAFIGVLTVFGVFWISVLRFLERWLDPMFLRMRKYAPLIARVTIGLSFLAAAYYQASYGPELPLTLNFGAYAGIVTVVLVAVGLMATFGFYTRVAAFAALILYSIAVWKHGWYMLTYVNYLGEIIVLLILGAHSFSLDGYLAAKNGTSKGFSSSIAWLRKAKAYLVPRSFMILRILFGVALIYASAYAKIIHNNLALDTVNDYHLDKLLGFEPHFLVLGAAIVELAIGLFFILGIEIRFTALFLLFWLTLSLIFFGEVVWPHLILIGIPIAYIFYGYDRYSLEGWLFRKKKYEPVL